MPGQLDRIKQQAKKQRLAGNLQKAKALYEQFLKAFPSDPEASLDLGDVYMKLEDFESAVRLYAKMLEKRADNPLVLSNLGGALLRQGKPNDARAMLEYALELDPKNIFARINLGGVLQAQGDLKKALENALEAVSIDPTHPLAFNNLGSAFSDLAMFAEAKHAFETAAMLDPKSIDALINLAGSESKLGNHQASIDRYEQVLAMLPPEAAQRAEAVKFFAAFEYLSLGNLKKGWEYYEGGFSPLVPITGARSPNRQFSVPKWDGRPLKGKTLLAWGEQGVGDELNFGTCLPELLNLDGNVIVEVDPRLVGIFQRSFPSFKVRPKQFEPVSKKPFVEDFDFHIPFASLFKFYRKTLDDFKDSGGFLKTDPDLDLMFKERLNKQPGEILVGICWRSGMLSPTRNLEYVDIASYEDIFRIPGARVTNLQYSFTTDEINYPEEKIGIKLEYWKDVDYKNDLDKVFSIISCLDLVVSVGSTPFAMAGSIDKLTFIPGGDGGWTLFGRKTSEGPYPLFKSVSAINGNEKELSSSIKSIEQEIRRRFNIQDQISLKL